jgi:hypothetical protein
MEPPKPSITFNAEQLHDPLGGQTFLLLLKNAGVQITPEYEALIKAANVLATATGQMGMDPANQTGAGEHGGGPDKTEPVNQHQRQKTGGVQGVSQ